MASSFELNSIALQSAEQMGQRMTSGELSAEQILDAVLEHTLRVTVYLKNPDDLPVMNEVYQEFFRKHKPARTTVPGVAWGKGVLVEIDAIALRIKD